MSKHRIIKPTHVIAASAIAALIGIALIFWAAVAAHAATSGTGAGIEAAPVCLGTPLHPGHSYELETNGFSDTKGADITNTGTGSEDLYLAVTRQAWHLPGMAVPSGWVSFGYPRHLLIFSSHDVSLSAGSSAIIPVTVTVPATAATGTYVAGLTVSTGTGTGGAQLGAADEVPLIFTVGISKPHWTARQMAATGYCWAPEGTYVSWQQSTGSAYPDPPPGWHWVSGTDGSWDYTPPPGWYETWTGSGQVYRGGHPVVTCASAALWTRRDGKLDDSVPWIGGQYPDTSTPAGCAAWLAASADHTLTTEPAVPSKAPAGPRPVRVHIAHVASTTRAGTSSSSVLGIVILAVVIVAIFRYAPRAVRWVAGR